MPINSTVKLCGAKARRNNHQPCRQPAMKNGRCRMHGGTATGPKTSEGKKKAAKANFKHGRYSNIDTEERKFIRKILEWRNDLDEIEVE